MDWSTRFHFLTPHTPGHFSNRRLPDPPLGRSTLQEKRLPCSQADSAIHHKTPLIGHDETEQTLCRGVVFRRNVIATNAECSSGAQGQDRQGEVGSREACGRVGKRLELPKRQRSNQAVILDPEKAKLL